MDHFKLSLLMLSNMTKVITDWQNHGDILGLKRVIMIDTIERFKTVINEIIEDENAKKETI